MSDISCFHENEAEAQRRQDDVAKTQTLERKLREVDEARKTLEGVKGHFLNLLNNIEQKNEFAKSSFEK